jgi:plastocyanin
MKKHQDLDNRRFDDEGNTRPTGSNYITVDRSDDGLDRRGFLRCMAWAGTATIWAMSSGTVTFAKPGTYSYFCSLHPMMQGKVVVTG